MRRPVVICAVRRVIHLIAVAAAVPACYTEARFVAETVWVELDSEGEPHRWFADPVKQTPNGAIFVDYEPKDDVMFFATRWTSPFGVPTHVWKDRDVVAYTGTGRTMDFNGSRLVAYEKQGGLDANERVRRAAARRKVHWDNWRWGHASVGHEPAVARVRVVADGRGIEGAFVAIVRSTRLGWRGEVDALRVALDHSDDPAQLSTEWVQGDMTDAEGRATVTTSVWVVRYRLHGKPTTVEAQPPQFLVVEHPRFGRSEIAIDPATPRENSEQPGTWSLELGAVDLNASGRVGR